jgi:hypothetical protein
VSIVAVAVWRGGVLSIVDVILPRGSWEVQFIVMPQGRTDHGCSCLGLLLQCDGHFTAPQMKGPTLNREPCDRLG